MTYRVVLECRSRAHQTALAQSLSAAGISFHPCTDYSDPPGLSLGEWIARTDPSEITPDLLERWGVAARALAASGQGKEPSVIRERGKRAPLRAAPIVLNVEQRALIEQAVEKVRLSVADPTLSEGRAVELVAADYLAST